MRKIVLAGAALAALAAFPAAAQPGPDRARPAGPLTRAAVQAQVDARFAAVDADRDGFVTQAEARARAEAGRAERQARRGERRAALFDRLDANRDGSISRAEFDARRPAARGEREGQREAGADRRAHRFAQRADRRAHRGALMARFGARAFAAMDADHDGRVSRAEASARALAMFDRADANRDGTVTIEERRAAREAFRGRRGS
jgi:Ca2+-binding EF-hand superfamily protein